MIFNFWELFLPQETGTIMTASFLPKLLVCTALVMAPVSAMAAFEFIPAPSRAPAPAAPAFPVPAAPESAAMQMTPAPASSVVSEALSASQARVSPQSILPPAPAAPRYALVPATTAAATNPAPGLNMNPLGTASNANASGTSSAGQLEQAMLANVAPAAAPSPAPAPIYSPSSVQRVSQGRSALGGLPAVPAPAAGGGGSYEEAVGFGRDLPLALAVGQIVPPDYAFNFDSAVNPGDTVSWEGGKPWDQVLNETLSPIGASARIDEGKKEIAIVRGAAPAAVTPFAAPAAYVPPAPPAPAAMAAPVPRPPMASANTPLYSPAASAPVTPAPFPAPAPLPVYEPAAPVAVPPQQAAPKMQLAGVSGSNVLDAQAKRIWEADRSMTLRAILTDWSMQAGVELFWSSDFDFPVESAVKINGTFEEAVQTLLRGLRDAQPRPIGRLHPNLPEGPSVLVIETKHILE